MNCAKVYFKKNVALKDGKKTKIIHGNARLNVKRPIYRTTGYLFWNWNFLEEFDPTDESFLA